MTETALKVCYDLGNRYVVGPLGCFDRGGVVEIPDRCEEAIIVAVDDDGAGIAYRTDWLTEQAEKSGTTVEQEIERRHGARSTSRRIDEVPQEVQQSIRRTMAKNRAKFGVLSRERVA